MSLLSLDDRATQKRAAAMKESPAFNMGLTANPLSEAYLDYNEAARKFSQFGFDKPDPRQFAQLMSALGDDRYKALDNNKFVRGLQRVGNIGDSVADSTGLSTITEKTFGALGSLVTDDPNTQSATERMGREIGGFTTNMALGAIVGAGLGSPVAGYTALSGLDAWTDTLETGGSHASAFTQGSLAALTAGMMPATGKFFERVGGKAAERIADVSSNEILSNSLRSGVLNAASRYVTREAGQFTAGTVADVAGMAIDPERSLSELKDEAYLIPMLIGNSAWVVADVAVLKPMSAGYKKIQNIRADRAQQAIEADAAAIREWEAHEKEVYANYLMTEYRAQDLAEMMQADKLYEDMYYKEYGAKTDLEAATLAQAPEWAQAADAARKGGGWSTPASFIDYFANHARFRGMDAGYLRTWAKSVFDNASKAGMTGAAAMTRVARALDNQRTRMFAELPENVRDTPTLYKYYKAFRPMIDSGEAQILFHDAENDVTAMAFFDDWRSTQLNPTARIRVMKNGKVLTEEQQARLPVEISDSINISRDSFVAEVQYTTDYIKAQEGNVFGASVSDRTRGWINETVAGLGLKQKIMVASFDDIYNDKNFRLLRPAIDRTDTRLHGKRIKIGDTSIVLVKNYNNPMVLAHELGHAVWDDYTSRFPTVLKSLEAEVSSRMSKMRKTGKKWFYENSHALPQSYRANKRRGTPPAYDHIEWFANQFALWTKHPDSPARSVVDKFFKDIVTKMRAIWEKVSGLAKYQNPSKEFSKFMNGMTKRFYANLMSNNDASFRSLVMDLQLPDQTIDSIARRLYENPDINYHWLMRERLRHWNNSGKNFDHLEFILTKTDEDYKRIRITNEVMPLLDLKNPDDVSKLLSIPREVTTRQKRALSERQKFLTQDLSRDQWKELALLAIKVADPDNTHIDTARAAYFIDVIHQRWLEGRLPYQKNTPKGGGYELLKKEISKTFKKIHSSKVIRYSLKTDNYFDASATKRKKFATQEDAIEAISEHKQNLAWAGHTFRPVKGTGKDSGNWFVSVEYDPRYMDAEYQDGLFQQSDAEIFEATQNFYDEIDNRMDNMSTADPRDAIRQVASRIHSQLDNEVLNSAIENAIQPDQDVRIDSMSLDPVRKSIAAKTAPRSLLDAIALVKQDSTDGDFKKSLRAVASELGVTSPTIDMLVIRAMEKLQRGEDIANIVELAPESVAHLLRESALYMQDINDIKTFAHQVGLRLGLHARSLESLRKTDFEVEKTLTQSEGAAVLADMMEKASQGGMAETVQRMTTLPGKIGQMFKKAYDHSILNVLHMSELDPIFKPFAEVMLAETRDQNRYINDTMIIIHAENPDVLTPVKRPGKAFTTVMGDDNLRNLFNEMVLLENRKFASIQELLKNKDPDLNEILNKVPQNKQADFMELRERMYKAQLHKVELRAVQMKELDRLAISRFITKLFPSLEPGKALSTVDALYQIDNPQALPEILLQSGLDEVATERILRFKQQLDSHTSDLIAKLESRPWYVSEQRFKRYVVRFFDPKEKRRGMVDFNTDEEARVWIEENKSQYKISDKNVEDTQITRTDRQVTDMRETLDSAAHLQKEIITSVFEDDKETAKLFRGMIDDMTQSVDESATAKTKGTANIARTFAAGRELLDAFEQFESETKRLAVGLSRARTDAYFALFGSDPQLRTGDRQRRYQLARQGVKNMREPDTELGNFISKSNFLLFMGFNASSIAQEIVSMPMIIAPLAIERGATLRESFSLQKRGVDNAMKFLLSDKQLDDPNYKMLFERAKRENTLTAKHLHDFDESIVLNDVNSRRVAEGDVGIEFTLNPINFGYQLAARMYQWGAEPVAMANLVVGFELAKKNNPKGDFNAWYQDAVNFHGMANGAMGRAGRGIGLFNTGGGARTISQAAFSLQSFSSAHIQNYIRLAGKSLDLRKDLTPAQRKQARKALAMGTALNVGALGLVGMPMAGGAIALYEKIFGTNLEEEFEEFLFDFVPGDDGTKSFMTNLATRGAAHAFNIPVDLQTRLAVGGAFAVNAYEGYDASFYAGAVGQLFEQTKLAMGAFARGDTAAQKVGGAVSELLPVGLRRMGRLVTNEGKVLSTRDGNYLFDATTTEAIGMVMGFTPTRQKLQSTIHQSKKYADEKQQKLRESVARRFLNMRERGEIQQSEEFLQQRATEMAGELGVSHEKELIRRKAFSEVQRKTVQQAPDPGTTQAARRISALNAVPVEQSATERYLMSIQNQISVGLDAQVDPLRMRQASAADDLMLDNPLMNTMMAERRVRNANPWEFAY